MSASDDAVSYAGSGVNLDAAEAAVSAIKPHVQRTHRREVVQELGGFSALFAFEPKRWRKPLLVSACDGVGTKLELARQLDRHDSIGVDLVAMVVDDLAVCGAEPLFFLDYIAVGKLDPAHVEQVVSGIADGCELAGCALVGGEMAEHPGVMPADRYDVAGFGVGVVASADLLGPERVEAGDSIIALSSNGLHSNGYSLARRVIEGRDLDEDHGLLVHSLGEALLRPTKIYAPDCLAVAKSAEVHAWCHVTGGGIPGNLPRCLPEGLGAVVDVQTFEVPMLFRLLQQWGTIGETEMWRTFNMGAGMLAIVPDGLRAVQVLLARGIDAWHCGVVTEGSGVRLHGLLAEPPL